MSFGCLNFYRIILWCIVASICVSRAAILVWFWDITCLVFNVMIVYSYYCRHLSSCAGSSSHESLSLHWRQMILSSGFITVLWMLWRPTLFVCSCPFILNAVSGTQNVHAAVHTSRGNGRLCKLINFSWSISHRLVLLDETRGGWKQEFLEVDRENICTLKRLSTSV